MRMPTVVTVGAILGRAARRLTHALVGPAKLPRYQIEWSAHGCDWYPQTGLEFAQKEEAITCAVEELLYGVGPWPHGTRAVRVVDTILLDFHHVVLTLARKGTGPWQLPGSRCDSRRGEAAAHPIECGCTTMACPHQTGR